MQATFIAAAVQMRSVLDKRTNLAAATQLVEQAAKAGATLIALPELFNSLGRLDQVVALAETIPGPSSEAMSQLAARLGITLLAGSIAEISPEPGKAFNTSLLFSPEGKLLASYRKMHLFDIDLPGKVNARESQHLAPGQEVVATSTPVGVLGQSICYDLRFPELYRQLASAGAEILLIPAAFTRATGQDHWQVLLQARAIENQSYVIAANQVGEHAAGMQTYGHSLILDPWGKILDLADNDQPQVVLAELRDDRLREIRQYLPALAHRRL